MEGRCSVCMALLLEMARAGVDPRLRSYYEGYAATGDENYVGKAVAEAGPELLARAKESIARRGLMRPEHLGVNAGPEAWANLSKEGLRWPK